MNKNLFFGLQKIFGNKSFPVLSRNQFFLKQGFCTTNNDKITRRFTYGQGG